MWSTQQRSWWNALLLGFHHPEKVWISGRNVDRSYAGFARLEVKLLPKRVWHPYTTYLCSLLWKGLYRVSTRNRLPPTFVLSMELYKAFVHVWNSYVIMSGTYNASIIFTTPKERRIMTWSELVTIILPGKILLAFIGFFGFYSLHKGIQKTCRISECTFWCDPCRPVFVQVTVSERLSIWKQVFKVWSTDFDHFLFVALNEILLFENTSDGMDSDQKFVSSFNFII